MWSSCKLQKNHRLNRRFASVWQLMFSGSSAYNKHALIPLLHRCILHASDLQDISWAGLSCTGCWGPLWHFMAGRQSLLCSIYSPANTNTDQKRSRLLHMREIQLRQFVIIIWRLWELIKNTEPCLSRTFLHLAFLNSWKIHFAAFLLP